MGEIVTSTYGYPHGLSAGDRLRVIPYSNRHRFGVDQVLSVTEVQLWHHIRPSRGYRKHLRRRKAVAR